MGLWIVGAGGRAVETMRWVAGGGAGLGGGHRPGDLAGVAAVDEDGAAEARRAVAHPRRRRLAGDGRGRPPPREHVEDGDVWPCGGRGRGGLGERSALLRR